MASISEAERLRRSEQARRMHSEVVIDPVTGEERRKFGGPQPGSGRKREKTAKEVLAEVGQREKEELAAQMLAIAKSGRSEQAKIQAITKFMDAEREVREEQRREEEHRLNMHRDDLLALFMERLEQLIRRGMISRGWILDVLDNAEAEGFIDAEPVAAPALEAGD